MSHTSGGHDTEVLYAALRQGDRAALGRAITLVESDRPDAQAKAQDLLERCMPHAGSALRLGITGMPGAGKSTLVDALGHAMVEAGHQVAVLAVDPSSPGEGPGSARGSILGDKTRMERLGRHPQAFIRPSPAGATLGGVHRRTPAAILLCEAAGFDRILVETVGVGQNEMAVERITDLILLVTIAGAGDELQGIKRGIMEAADLLALNKADAVPKELHDNARRDLLNALTLLPVREGGRRAMVMPCSALTGQGIDAIWKALEDMAAEDRTSGRLEVRRARQARWWMRQAIEEALMDDFRSDPTVAAMLPAMEEDVAQGRTSPFRAAAMLLERFRKGGAPLP